MSLLETKREQRAAKEAEIESLIAAAESREVPDLSDDEFARVKELRNDIKSDDERIAELEVIERNRKVEAETRKAAGDRPTGNAQVEDAPVYAEKRTDTSYFRDLYLAKLQQDAGAVDRLVRNNRQVEARALGNTNAAGGSGGEFAPPEWLTDRWINIIRKGRVLPDLYEKMPFPDGVSSINIPKITGGTTTAIQSMQNTALSQTDMTTSYVQTGWATVGGKQVVSQQLIDQSAIPFDRVVLNDLAASYAQQIGALAYTGAGTGSGTNSVINGISNATIGSTQTWTQASPTVAGFYGQTGNLLSSFLAARLAPPTAWVMHPRRWYWLVSASDSQGRPLVVPVGPALNQIATQDSPAAVQGFAGYLHGLPVYLDPQVPTNIGAGTNQDVVYLLKADDLLLFESAPRSEVFRETYADNVGVLFRLYAYVGTMLNRHSESLGLMTGTGLVPPTFAS